MSEEFKGWEKAYDFDFEVKDIKTFEDRYEFEGHASVFDIPDKIDDVVDPGAFKRTIDHHKGKFPIVEMHDKTRMVGNGFVHEDKKGLAVSPGVLIRGLPAAENAYLLLKHKVYDGMSFSFRAIRRYFKGRHRHLKELAVGELTLAPKTMICHPNALITDVKFLETGMILDNHLDRLRGIVGVKLWEDNPGFQEIRYRTRNPDDFQRLRSWWITENSIRAIGGPLKTGGGVVIQALRFLRSAGWTLAKAREWVREHPDVKIYEVTAGISFAISPHDIKIESA